MYIQPLFRQLVAAARTELANPPLANPLPASSTPPPVSPSTYTLHFTLPLYAPWALNIYLSMNMQI